MLNILSYLGMSMQSEVCLWTLLGLLRTIFDATLFKVNANLKQVWQMSMPDELSMPVQRLLRTMISGVMLVQCFTVYVYLASYIVLLYPVFLEERPTLVLPWLLLAAVRKLLCELTSLALGLGTCVLLGPARSSCIKFVIVKVASIMPSFYMWMLVLSYYHVLKVTSTFKTFAAVLPTSNHDYGLELAVRRRCTKSLLGKDQLRKKLVANFYGERSSSDSGKPNNIRPKLVISSRMVHSTDTSAEEFTTESPPTTDILQTISFTSNKYSYLTQTFEDWSGSEVIIPRDTDRILEQFVLMLLRIGAYLKKDGIESINSQIMNSPASNNWVKRSNINLQGPVVPEDTETPPQVGSQGNTAWYLNEYPQIFMKKQSTEIPDGKVDSTKIAHSRVESIDGNTLRSRKRVVSVSSNETISVEVNKIVSKRKIIPRNSSQQSQSHEYYDKAGPSKQGKIKQNLDSKTETKSSDSNKHTQRLTNDAKMHQIHQESIEEETLSRENLMPSNENTKNLMSHEDTQKNQTEDVSFSPSRNHNYSSNGKRSSDKTKSSTSSETDSYEKSEIDKTSKDK